MAVSLYNQYKDAILTGDVSKFRELWEFHPISEADARFDLRELIMKSSTSRDIIIAAFDIGFVQKTDVYRFTGHLDDSPDFVRWKK